MQNFLNVGAAITSLVESNGIAASWNRTSTTPGYDTKDSTKKESSLLILSGLQISKRYHKELSFLADNTETQTHTTRYKTSTDI